MHQSNSVFDGPNMSRVYSDRYPHSGREETDMIAPSIGSYQEYPPDRPYINTDYRRDPTKPIDSFPENNRDIVMDALHSLQGKIRQLELERGQAEDNLRTIAHETSHYRESMRHDPDVSNLSANMSVEHPGNLTLQNSDIKGKLDSAEGRCNVLEKQLEYMRKMVHSAEQDRSDAVRKTAMLQQQQVEIQEEDIRSHLSKLNNLERDHLKMTATQTLAENKIRELEDKLREEKQHRRMMQGRAAEMETAAETNRILLEATGGRKQTAVKKTKKKKKPVKTGRSYGSSMKPQSRKKHGMEPPEHYRLNLGDIPFTAGQSTSPSHSIAANFQEVLSLMKTHNSKLCKSPRQHSRNGYKYLQSKGGTSSSSGISTGSSEHELNDLLLQLQDEFGHMSFEHQELSRQIQQCTDPRLREDLERELDSVVARMEAKGEQIGRLRRHQELLSSKSLKKTPRSRPTSARASMPSNMNGEIEVTTTIKTKPKSARRYQEDTEQMSPRALQMGSSGKAQASLNLLKDLKKIQTTLRKDDISWE